jgi:hypothetical protein
MMNEENRVLNSLQQVSDTFYEIGEDELIENEEDLWADLIKLIHIWEDKD